ncbi:hypothetical protein N836_23785 [Leptolyngbya sp. Heron Island J]|uniref:hypothetical protein n=1 Tax=Leptolyngbya sp. Heron Island J TaxID=1385935 RepID=UPI0003B963D2|nr:hypothetical protein [Leptolyngbya sp. Heron Island J]ESA33088.1 hypothetical protein N836_23785 [Leptolyngbya sp. Heron Island J]
MDIGPEKVTHLSNRVDNLQQLLEQIDCKVSDLLVRQDTNGDAGQPKFGVSPPERMVANGLEEAFDHKDILNDEPHFGLDQLTGNQSLSPEIQVQRLTAQLTAAYNRIAALEEQLLTYRAH